MAEVLRTYGSESCNPCRRGSASDLRTAGRGIEDMVRMASPRMSGFRSAQSFRQRCSHVSEIVLVVAHYTRDSPRGNMI